MVEPENTGKGAPPPFPTIPLVLAALALTAIIISGFLLEPCAFGFGGFSCGPFTIELRLLTLAASALVLLITLPITLIRFFSRQRWHNRPKPPPS